MLALALLDGAVDGGGTDGAGILRLDVAHPIQVRRGGFGGCFGVIQLAAGALRAQSRCASTGGSAIFAMRFASV